MTRATATFGSLFLLLASACSAGDRSPVELDCSIADAYEFRNISNFNGTMTGWYQYADATPGGVPNIPVDGSNVPVTLLETPGRCGDIAVMKLAAWGHNFWGTGFGDYEHNPVAARAVGTGYEGISFWARAARNSEKQFMLHVDDGRTVRLDLAVDVNGDGIIDDDEGLRPGDIVPGTSCRLPPPDEVGEAACYNGGVDGPASAGVRVPVPGECGNSFHTRVTATENWQLVLIPWNELVQWPCPNRLGDEIDEADIAKFEIKFEQGTRYEIWIDNIAFYRRRP